MKFRNSHKGFSLVELVVVVGIVGIIASMSIIIITRLRVANVEKVVKTITTNLTKVQMKSMSKENKPYLHIYMVGDDYYLITSESDTYDASTMGTKGTKLGSGLTITYNTTGTVGADTVIGGATMLAIGYKKDGTFMSTTPANITVTTSVKTTVIKLNKLTGKYVLE